MKHIFPIIGLIFLLSSCIKNNPDPVWVEINEWTLQSNPLGEDAGVLSQNISEAWVYIDNDFVGVFEVPCKIPVMYSGEKTIRVYPAVLNNGISATKKIYPFLNYHEITADFVANETITVDPATSYLTSTKFWIEDFEAAGFKIENDPNSDVTIGLSSDPQIINPALNGNNFGRVQVNSADNSWIAYSSSSEALNLPVGKEVYLEIDYYNTNRVTTGLLAVSPSGTVDNPNIQLNPQDPSEIEWKKLYIDLREIVGGSANGSYFQLSFQALLNDDDTEGEINIDNIKVVYF